MQTPKRLVGYLALSLLVFASAEGRSGETPFVAQTKVLLSGVYLHGYLDGTPSLDSAVRLVNTDPTAAVDISGFALSDRFSPRKQRKGGDGRDPLLDEFDIDKVDDSTPQDTGKRRGRPKEDRVLTFPPGTTIPAGGEIWVAATAQGFAQVFGINPRFEASDTDPQVPDLSPANGFLWLNEGYGTVALIDRRGKVIDFVAWMGPKQDAFPDGSLDDAPWNGGPVALKLDTDYGWTGRVLGRSRDEAGRVLGDTDRAADWPVGFSRMQLGVMPTHRVELAAQTRFVTNRLEGVRAKVLATSAPDNNYAALIAAFDSAKKELRVRIYEMTGAKIADALIKTKKRGVKVWVFLEGSPVGGLSDQGRWITDRLHKAGINVHFLATPRGSKVKPRYRFDHSKYVLVDDRLAIIGTENYGRTGVPVINSYGNRGWMIHVENAEFVRQLRAVWDADYRTDMGDVIAIDASPDDSLGLPYRDPAFVPSEKIPTGTYPNPAKPALVDDTMALELVLSPDTSLNENSAIIGMIARAKTTLLIEQNSVLPYWGKKPKAAGDKDDKPEVRDTRGPNLPLQAVIAAARRGVRVRVLLDGTWYNAEQTDERDNDNTVVLLNELAKKEGLDLSAKVINLESTHLEKIHTKGVIADGEVFVGSINWSENSFLGNREVGVIVSHPKVAGYYTDLFWRDWSQSRLYAMQLATATEVRDGPDGKVIGRKPAKERVDVVAEREVKGERWLELSLGMGKTGFINAAATDPTVYVTPRETMYVIGRDAIVTGTIVGVRETEKVTQLQFFDPERPPFIAAIFKKDLPKFPPPAGGWIGKTVRMTGPIKVYVIPEIILSKPEQIQVVP